MAWSDLFDCGCSCATGTPPPPPGVDLPTCFCQNLPGSVELYYVNGSSGSLTLTYGPPPIPFKGGGGSGYWSTQPLPGLVGESLYYFLTCSYNLLSVGVLETNIPNLGPNGESGTQAFPLASFVLDGKFNICSPFRLACQYFASDNDGVIIPYGALFGINAPPAGRNGAGHCDASLPPIWPPGSYGNPSPTGTAVAMAAEPLDGPTGPDRPGDLDAELVIARYQEDVRWAEEVA